MFQVNVLLVFFKMFLLNFAITNKELYLYVLCIGILWHFNYSLGLESSVSILRTLSILLLILFKDSKCCFICTKPIRKYEKKRITCMPCKHAQVSFSREAKPLSSPATSLHMVSTYSAP